MACAAIAGRAVAQLAGVLFGIGHQIGNVLDRQIGVHHVQARHLGQQAHRYKVLFGVPGQLVKDVGVDGQRADVTKDDGALVLCTRYFLHGDIACGAGFVVHKHVLTQRLGEFGCGGAGHNFRAATGCERHNKANRAAGPVVIGRLSHTGQQAAAGQRACTRQQVAARDGQHFAGGLVERGCHVVSVALVLFG